MMRKRVSITGVFGAVLLSSMASGQVLTVEVDDPRPILAASLKIEEISGIAVNYEDVRYEHAEDLQDITDEVMSPEQRALARSPVQIIVPRGGELSVPVAVDSATKRLLDIGVASAAMYAVLSRSAAEEFPGEYMIETYRGMLFVKPSRSRNASGALVSRTPILSTAVTFEREQRSAYETLEIILGQVSKATGYRVEIGTVPIGGLANAQVTIGASEEAAYQVLAKVLASVVSGEMAAPEISTPTMSYKLLYDPRLKFYAFNAHVVGDSKQRVSSVNPEPPSPAKSDRFFRKK